VTTAGLRVIAPGPLATVQDRGRPGYQRYGVSVSGAVDEYALVLGNLLVGNDRDAAALEVTLGIAEFEFLEPAAFAVTGGDLGATLAGAPVPMWQEVPAEAGDRLAFAAPVLGLRAYLCVAGGFDTPPALGSRATHIGSKLGGFEGRALQTDDELPFGDPGSDFAGRMAPDELRPAYAAEVTIRVVPGPQDDAFTEEGRTTFYDSAYTVTDQLDRMGARLDGPVVEAIDGRYDIVSDAVPRGSVQIPGDGKPIVLLADRQTTGGYAKIAVVATADLPLLAQAGPGTVVRFAPVEVEEAEEAARLHLAALDEPVFETALQAVTRHVVVDGGAYEVDLPPDAGSVAAGESRRLDVLVNGRAMRVDVEKLAP